MNLFGIDDDMTDDDWAALFASLPSHTPTTETVAPPPCRETPDWTVWSDDPFGLTTLPYGAYLEPEGYAAITDMTRPVLKSYKRLMPRTYSLAVALHGSLPQKSTWGRQIARDEASSWVTVTAGKWRDAKRRTHATDGTVAETPRRGWMERAMSVMDVVKMLASPDHHAMGNTDTLVGLQTGVRHLRVDIDMDDTFGAGATDNLTDTIRIVKAVYAAFGLTAHVFRTGNRGIQAVATIPEMDRRDASVLTRFVRTVLAGSRLYPCRVKDFQTSLDGIMRLPLGRHGLTDSLGLFVGDDGLVLGVEQQVTCALAAIAAPPAAYNASWATEIAECLPASLEPHQPIQADMLRQIVQDCRDNALVQTFLRACREYDVRDWGDVPVQTNVEHSTTLVVADHPTLSENAYVVSNWRSPRRLKEIGRSIIDKGYEPGASFEFFMNGAGRKNAVGWALVITDGDQQAAEDMLVAQARRIGGSDKAIQDRVSLIRRLIPKNDTYERFQRRRITRKHRNQSGDVLASETSLAQALADTIPAIAKARGERKRPSDNAVAAMRHIMEIVLLAVRESEDGLARLSLGTLVAEINRRWPEDAVTKTSLYRHMDRITAGAHTCLVEALSLVERPSRVTDATVYALGPALIAMIPVETPENEVPIESAEDKLRAPEQPASASPDPLERPSSRVHGGCVVSSAWMGTETCPGHRFIPSEHT